MKSASDLWPSARPILLPYEGSASQFYVFDLPITSLVEALRLFCERTTGVRVSTLDGYSYPTSEVQAFSPEIEAKIASATQQPTYNVLQAEWHGIPLSLYLWIEPDKNMFDAEFVFWADHLFPNPDDPDACEMRFTKLIELAESFRSFSPHSECAFTASESGDPRDDRKEPWTLFW